MVCRNAHHIFLARQHTATRLFTIFNAIIAKMKILILHELFFYLNKYIDKKISII